MKQKSIVPIVALTALVLFPSVSHGDFDGARWQFFKEIRGAKTPGAEYAFFQVDDDIYDGSAGSLHTIRIIDANAREIPHQIVTKRESEKREQFTPKLLNNSYQRGKHNSFVLDFGEEPPRVNELTILTTSKNFTRRVSVDGGSDQSEWNLLADEAYIFDFSRNAHTQYLQVEFPLSNFRFLRVKIFDDGNGPLEIAGAKTFRVTKEAAKTETWPLTITEKTENKKERTTNITLDAGYRGLPIRNIQLDVASRNYHRSITVESSADCDKWVVLGTGVIYNYDVSGFERTDNRVSFRENAGGRYFRLSLENYDDEPLEIGGASGSGLIRRVVIPVEKRKQHKVYFGNPVAKIPRYDLSYRIPYIETERLPRLALSARRLNANYTVPPKPARPWTEQHPYLLWAVMAAVIIFLLLLILNLWRKTPPDATGD